MSITEFFLMNGYGFFIWSSFGMMLFVMLVELFSLKWNRKKNIGDIRKTIRILQENHESSK